MPAELRRRGHSKNADAPEAIDHFPRNIGISVNRDRVQFRIEKFAQLLQRLIELSLLGISYPRIRHYPVGNEMATEQAFDEAERLRAGEQQFLGLLHFLLSL